MKITKKWMAYYENLGTKVLLVDLNNANDFKKIIDVTNEIMTSLQEKEKKKA